MKDLIKQLEPGKEPDGRAVYIIRHGQTKLNAEDKIRAWLNIPLDEVGHQQAHELGEQIRDAGIELDGIIASDLLRTQQTALAVSAETGIPILGMTKALRPWNVGTYSGKDGKMVHGMMMKLVKNDPDQELGGGESFNQFKYRILTGIIGMLNAHRGLKLGFVSHSRGERILHAWCALGCPENLDIDIQVFGEKGEPTASAQELFISCPLVFT